MDMENKTVLISGATDGIGKVTALELAKMGADLVIVGRNPEKTEKVAAEMRSQLNGSGSVDLIVANLASLAGIRSVAQQYKDKHNHLEVLINNAGAYFVKRQTSPDGLEMTFALNHMNYFYLTSLLLDVLKASAPARIVNVSSAAHYGTKVEIDDLMREKKYKGYQVYGQSKLMNIYFTHELSKRLEGSGVTVNALHPGFVATNFGRSNGGIFNPLFKLSQLGAISPEEGAKTSIYLASSPDVAQISGKYFDKCEIKEPSKEANDDQAAAKLWQISEQIIKDKTGLNPY